MKRLLRTTKLAHRFSQSAIGNRQSAIPAQSEILWLLTLAFSLWTLDLATAQSPTLIPYQGRLTNPQGVPYTNGQYTLAFTLYDQPVGGSVIWGPETHYRVGVINGMVNVFLGSINAITNVDFSQTRHLGITIYADNNPNNPAPEMVPRQMIIPAFWAKNAEKLSGYDWTPVFGVNSPVGPLPGGKIQNQSITAGQIANNTITTAQIANGAITSSQLAAAAVTGSAIANGSISALQIALGGIQTSNLADGSVTWPKLAPRLPGTNSAVAGIGGFAISADSGLVSISTSTVTIFTNLTVTITTTGRPVFVGLVGTSTNTSPAATIQTSGANNASLYLKFVRGSTVISEQEASSGASGQNAQIALPPSALHTIDVPPSGTYTYSFQIDPTGDSGSVVNCRLVAFEL